MSGLGSSVVIDLVVILFLSSVVATVFAKLRLEAIPGYLVAGAIAGPHAMGLVRSGEAVEQISQLAVILLMFGIGLHLDASHIGKGMVHVLGIGLVSTLAFTALAFPVCMWAGLEPPVALGMAMALSISSTAILVRVVATRREIRAVHARVGLGTSIVQDLFAVVVLGVLPFLARWAGVETPTTVATGSGLEGWFDTLPTWMELVARTGVSVGGIVVLTTVGHYLLPGAMRIVSASGSGELMLVFSAAVGLGAAVSTRVLGFSAEMGAFMAGFLLATTPFRHQLAGQFAPVRDILMAIFFTAVGLNVDPMVIVQHPGLIAAATVGITVLKVLSVGLTGWAMGLTPRSAILTGVYLGNAGEFALVLITAAAAIGLFAPDVTAVIITTVVCSLTISPLLIGPAHRVASGTAHWAMASWVKSDALRETPGPGQAEGSVHAVSTGHVVIAGFGPVGRAIADRLEVAGVSLVVIELNPNTVQRQSRIGRRRIVYGDVTNEEVLASAGVREASAFVVTVPDEDTALRAVQAVRAMAPSVFIAARTSYLSGSFKAHQLGADHVTVEEVATAETMQREVLVQLRKRVAQREDGPGPTGGPPEAETSEAERQP